ncbi:BRCT domain-containing protein [Campylobacter majalis]|uniref:BRCT domain-containing protein n=1 Tax=Campylobacter majalis TaxID=2790656 RepID=UPI003D68A156
MFNPHQRPAYIYDATTRAKLAELIKICQNSLSDDKLDMYELSQIVEFIEKNTDDIHSKPFFEFVEKLADILNLDDTITENELNIAKVVIKEYINTKPKSLYDEIVKTNDSFFDNPQPEITFKNKIFVLTGIFTIAEREDVAKMIIQRGGLTSRAVTRDTDYLVVGEVASSAYSLGNYGSKIKKAVDNKARGAKVAIITEQHFIKFIQPNDNLQDVSKIEVKKDIQEQNIEHFLQKEIKKEDRTFYGITLEQDNFYCQIPFNIFYNHSNLGVTEVRVKFLCYRNGCFIIDAKRYDPKRIIKAIDERNGNEVKNYELLEYIFKNLDDDTLKELFIKGILKDIPSGRALYDAGFRSLDEIAKITDKNLLKIKGIGGKKLIEIREFLNKNSV